MSQYFVVCDSDDLVIVDNFPHCTDWQFIDVSLVSNQSILPLTDLTTDETVDLMAASATFLVVCYLGRMLVRSAFSSGND